MNFEDIKPHLTERGHYEVQLAILRAQVADLQRQLYEQSKDHEEPNPGVA